MEVTTHVAFDSGTGETKVLKLKEMETLPELSEQLKALVAIRVRESVSCQRPVETNCF
jgi:hypothetical protein